MGCSLAGMSGGSLMVGGQLINAELINLYHVCRVHYVNMFYCMCIYDPMMYRLDYQRVRGWHFILISSCHAQLARSIKVGSIRCWSRPHSMLLCNTSFEEICPLIPDFSRIKCIGGLIFVPL